MPFFVKGDGTKQQDEKFMYALHSTFGITGSTVLHHHHPGGHPMLLDCMDTPPPMEKGERRCPRALAAARAFRCARARRPRPPGRHVPLLRILPYNSFTRLDVRLWYAGWMPARS